MPGKVRLLLEEAASQPMPSGLEGWNDTYVFVAENDENVTLTIRDGVARTESNHDPVSADCVIKADEDELVRVLRGEENAQTAWMRGMIDIQGDLPAAQRLSSFMRWKRGTAGSGAAS